MKEFRKILREALPEMIGGLAIAVIITFVSTEEAHRLQYAGLVTVAGLVVVAVIYAVASGADHEGPLPAPSSVAAFDYAPPGIASKGPSIGRLCLVPSGPFIFGSPLHAREMPPRRLFVPEFEIAQNPVTVGQYTVFLQQGGPDDQQWWSEAGWAWRQGQANGWGRNDRAKPHDWFNQERRVHEPVVGITWYEAEAYCAWLGAQMHKLVRLPGEQEWERAARGEDGRMWPWGNTFERRFANTHERGLAGALAPGAIPGDRSPFDVADLCGNVQDWTASPYQPLDGEDLPSDDLRVARGGSWNDTAFGSRTSFRHVYPPGYFFPYLGFRIVVARL